VSVDLTNDELVSIMGSDPKPDSTDYTMNVTIAHPTHPDRYFTYHKDFRVGIYGPTRNVGTGEQFKSQIYMIGNPQVTEYYEGSSQTYPLSDNAIAIGSRYEGPTIGHSFNKDHVIELQWLGKNYEGTSQRVNFKLLHP
jgi:hypothetical protein